MQTSRFQLGLMAALAMSLGFSLASSDAVGYPAGPVVSSGGNPLWSKNGSISTCTMVDILTVPEGQVAVVTGLNTQNTSGFSILQDGASVLDGSSNAAAANASFFLNQGALPIPAGSTLTLQNNSCSRKAYFIQGYYMQE